MGAARPVLAVAWIAFAVALAPLGIGAQPHGGHQPTPPPAAQEGHGTPGGWRFAWPKGDAGKGRDVFAKFECYACHRVNGETFPTPKDEANLGPELSAMGPLHEAEYFAESIMNPSATIEKGKGYEGADGSSKMPSFNDSMTVDELINLVAYLRSLNPTAGRSGGHQRH